MTLVQVSATICSHQLRILNTKFKTLKRITNSHVNTAMNMGHWSLRSASTWMRSSLPNLCIKHFTYSQWLNLRTWRKKWRKQRERPTEWATWWTAKLAANLTTLAISDDNAPTTGAFRLDNSNGIDITARYWSPWQPVATVTQTSNRLLRTQSMTQRMTNPPVTTSAPEHCIIEQLTTLTVNFLKVTPLLQLTTFYLTPLANFWVNFFHWIHNMFFIPTFDSTNMQPQLYIWWHDASK